MGQHLTKFTYEDSNSRIGHCPSLTHHPGHTSFKQREQWPLGKDPNKTHFSRIEEFVEFLVIDVEAVYHAFLGHPWV